MGYYTEPVLRKVWTLEIFGVDTKKYYNSIYDAFERLGEYPGIEYNSSDHSFLVYGESVRMREDGNDLVIYQEWCWWPDDACRAMVARFRPIYICNETELTFRVGDVIDVISDNADRQMECIVAEVISVDDTPDMSYTYNLARLTDPFSRFFRCGESEMEFNYHDTNWEEYYTESAGNMLPPWRGRLYNINEFISHYGFYDVVWREGCFSGRGFVEEYAHDTIPPVYMIHNIMDYGIEANLYNAIATDEFEWDSCKCFVLPMKPKDKWDVIEEELHINRLELHELRWDAGNKIRKRNDLVRDIVLPANAEKKLRFTEKESALIDAVSQLNDAKEYPDHFIYYPAEMTNLQIMHSIKEAYSTAKRVSIRSLEMSRKSLLDEKEYVPVNGRILYEGVSDTYGLVIHFIYDFDLNLVETAYPVRRVKKSGKRQDTEEGIGRL